MKYSSLIAPALTAALLLGVAAPALAEDSGGDGTVGINPTNTINIKGGIEREDDGRPRLVGSTTLRVNGGEEGGRGHASTTGQRIGQKIQNEQERAGNAIDQRIKSLQELSARLAGMKLISPDVLASIKASLDAEIASLTALNTKIGTDTSTTTVKADSAEITKSNRVYLVVEPKARIAASASRINAVVTQMQLLVTKLQARLTTAQTAGVDVTASTAALTDLSAKIADAKVQADAAVSETANLQADNGDATIKASNLAALKDARTKLDTAEKDLAAARSDAAKVYGVVKGKEGKGQNNSTTTGNQ